MRAEPGSRPAGGPRVASGRAPEPGARDGRARPRLELGAPVIAVRGIGPVRSRAMAEAGYRTVGDLLFHLPFRYEDRRHLTAVGAIDEEGIFALIGRLAEIKTVRIFRRRLTLVRGRVEDESGRLDVVWFNRPYLASQVSAETEYLLVGTVRRRQGRLALVNPTCEAAPSGLHGGRIVPVYPSLAGLGPASLRRIFDGLLEQLDPARQIADELPAALRRRHGLPSLGEALDELHRPPDGSDVEALNGRSGAAHRRLIYGELLELQLELELVRRRQTRRRKRHRYRIGDALRRRVREILPFRLTGAQTRVLGEIVADLRRPYPMLRLLQGDVGSGKTIVAALALVAAMESGLQGAFMAPTELLAEQHYRSLRRILGERYELALVSASAARAETRERLAAGDIQLAVGTHALIQEGVRFHRLGLSVIDEQHRFGVAQRRRLQAKGESSDVLVMTATPIPRSLALTAYGDLALSVLDELPPGRRPVSTRVVPLKRRREVYEWLRRRLDEGAQAYVVFPLIEESERVAAASIEDLGERLKGFLGDVPAAVLHGRLDPAEREAVMGDFVAARVQVLIATTVIEVGVDVPAASIMIIESAERFGLAQLHQLRGRVGRGEAESHCVALHGPTGQEARRRLETFAASHDGFEIAEADLEIRGPGELLGTRQAGLPVFRAADLVRDRAWLETARRDAQELLAPGAAVAPALLERIERRAGKRLEALGGG